MKLWGGRFAGSSDALAADFGRSIEVDAALALDDLAGSIAHVRGLGRAGLLDPDEVAALVAGLEGLRGEVEAGTIAWDPALWRTSTSTSRPPSRPGSARWPASSTPAARATTRS